MKETSLACLDVFSDETNWSGGSNLVSAKKHIYNGTKRVLGLMVVTIHSFQLNKFLYDSFVLTFFSLLYILSLFSYGGCMLPEARNCE
jgi:hypothetical protein